MGWWVLVLFLDFIFLVLMHWIFEHHYADLVLVGFVWCDF